MPSVYPTDRLSAVKRAVAARFFGLIIFIRLAIAPVVFAFGAWVVAVEPQSWRTLLIIPVMFLAMVSIGGLRRWQAATHDRQHLLSHADLEDTSAELKRNFLFASLFQPWVVFSTGGLVSPVLPATFVLSTASALFLSRRTSAVVILGFHLPLLWVMAYLQTTGTLELVPLCLGGQSPSSSIILGLASSLSLVLLFTWVVGFHVTISFARLKAEAHDARSDLRARYEEETRAMTQLSNELAEQVKGPLDRIKAQQRSWQLTGEDAKRHSALCDELDRVQSVLETFLTFSRPITPLSLSEVDLRALAQDVVALFESEAHLAVLKGVPAVVTCDAQKVKQALLYLMSHVLGTTSRQGHLALYPFPLAGGGVELRLLAEGVTPQPAEGLGLTVARVIVEQHGGTLNLDEPDCQARLTLPRRPPSPLA